MKEWELNNELLRLIEENGATIEYSSPWSMNNAYSLLQIKIDGEKDVIAVPKYTKDSLLKRHWSIAHELGHLLLEKECAYDRFTTTKYDQESLAWNKAKEILIKCNVPLYGEGESFEGAAIRALHTYEMSGAMRQNASFWDRPQPRETIIHGNATPRERLVALIMDSLKIILWTALFAAIVWGISNGNMKILPQLKYITNTLTWTFVAIRIAISGVIFDSIAFIKDVHKKRR